jgi:hypothetical protein
MLGRSEVEEAEAEVTGKAGGDDSFTTEAIA